MKRSSVANRDNRDFFFDLPECLILLIISFLPFKEAAKTSVLSKMWLNRWRRTTNVEFKECYFVDPEESEENKSIQRRTFVNFAREWVGNYGDPTIDKLCVTLSKLDQFATDVNRLISFAVAKNAKSLSLVFSDPESNEPSFDLPQTIYNHEIFESLVLFSCKLDASGFKNLSLLKELSLGCIELKEKSIRILVKRCPNLQSLVLTKCWNIERFVTNKIRLEKLKKLVLESCSFSVVPIWIYVENAPKLHFFKYTGNVASFDLDYLKSMREVQLDFGLEGVIRNNSADLICNLILQLFSVTKLTVCSFMLQEYNGTIFRPVNSWTKTLFVNESISRSLKMVEVKSFKGSWNELQVMEHLIRFGRKLEHVNLYISKEDRGNEYREKAQSLLGLRKSSNNLQISII